jgi:poly(hydroxyalkanoate) granule-associated protein
VEIRMAKKKPKKESAPDDLRDSAHKIWLAGLGAMATAEEEGGKLFRKLVSKGERYERRVRDPIDRATGSVRGTVKKVRTEAGRTVERVEAAVDEHVGGALQRLGVPTRREIAALTRRVEDLTRAIQDMQSASGKGGRKPPRKKAARKTTTGRATAKKAAKTTAKKTAKKAAKKPAGRAPRRRAS